MLVRLLVIKMFFLWGCLQADSFLFGGGGGLLLRGFIEESWNANGFVGYEINENTDEILPRMLLSYTRGNLGYGEKIMPYHSIDFIMDWTLNQEDYFFEMLAGIGAGYSYAMPKHFTQYHAGNFLLRLGGVAKIRESLEAHLVLTARLMMQNVGDKNLDALQSFLNRPSLQIYQGGILAFLPELSFNLVFRFHSPY